MATAQLSRPNVETEAEVEAQIAADLHIQWETPSTPPNPDDYVIVNGILNIECMLMMSCRKISAHVAMSYPWRIME